MQEFQANANSYSAEFGRAGGGVINAVTRSGTNELHGSAYWFYRDRSMNANDPVNKLNRLPKDPYHFNQLGGALGGPILKSRLFFFANYEGLRSATPNAIFLGLPEGFQLSSNQTVAGFQQLAFDYLRPRAASWVRPLAQDDYLAKLDWKISQVHLLTGRWNRQSFTGAGPGDVNPQNSFEHTSPAPVNTDTIDLSLTSTISSTMINVIRFGYVGSSIAFAAESANPEASIFEGGQLVLTIGRESGSPQDSLIHRGQWSDTFSYHRGRHTLRTGADLLLDRITFFIAKSFSGSYTFNSLESFGRSLAGAPGPCMGLPCPGDSYQQAFSGSGTPGSITHPNIVAIAGFVQDEWRLKPRLTLNIGARYDLQVTARPPVKNPSSALKAAGLDTSSLATDKDNFAPRLGLAWAPLRNGHLVVRAGYGIFYGLTPSVLTARAHFQNGISVQTRTFSGGTASAVLTPSYPNNFCGPPDPSGVPPTCAPPATGASSPTLQLFSSRYTQPYVQQASLGFEVRVQKDVGVSVSYLLARGTHLQRIRDVNLGTPTTPATIGIANTSTELAYQKFTLPRPIAGFDRILLFESNANSIYHGLALQVNKRFSNNLQFLASYTLGKVIDDNPNVYALSTSPSNPLLLSDPSNPRGERGPGSNDQRHRLVLSGVWELNYGRSLPSEARAILGGWQLSGILTAQSGQPYSGLVRFDLNNDGDFATDRTPGLGRNTFYLPATISFDPRVTRNVVLRERLRLQFIWEAFNVLNHANIAAVRTTQYVRSASPAVCGIASASCLVPQSFGVNAFGIPFQSFGPRIMQLAVKVSF